MYFRYRLSLFGKFIIIYILSIVVYYFLCSYIEQEYLKKINENCKNKGYHEDYKIHINCDDNSKEF